jgi:hypothetical protein
VGNTILSSLGAVGYINPDTDGGPSVTGPAGHIIREVLIGLTIFQLASQLRDKTSSRALGAAAADMIFQRAQQMKEGLK